MAEKLDLKRTDRGHYAGRPGTWSRVMVPACRYLAVDGAGAPEGADYAAALGRLYPVAYGVKFAMKARGCDFVVPPQSTQWWAKDPGAFVAGRRDEWRWRALLRMPDVVTQAEVTGAAQAKGIEGVDFLTMEEGDCFQTLHIGPYRNEGPVLARLHEVVMPEARVTFGLPHHEIYLSDPRRVAPDKLRTILRQPVVPI